MIRLGKHENTNRIEISVSEAKDLVKSFENNQWDDRCPTPERFKADIDTKTLYVLEEDNTIYGLIVVDQQQSEWYDNLEWSIGRNNAYVIHRLVGFEDYKGAATQLFDFAVKLVEKHYIHVILTDTFALNKPAQDLFEKFGLQEVGETKIDYHPFSRGVLFYAYHKNI